MDDLEGESFDTEILYREMNIITRNRMRVRKLASEM